MLNKKGIKKGGKCHSTFPTHLNALEYIYEDKLGAVFKNIIFFIY